MKSFRKFLILFAIPVLAICVIALVLDTNQDNFRNPRTNVLVPTFFAIISAVYVYVFENRLRSFSYFSRFLFSLLLVCIASFIAAYSILYFYNGSNNSKIQLSQAMLCGLIFTIYIVVLRIYTSLIEKIELILPEKPFVYLRLLIQLSVGISALWILFSYDIFLTSDFTFSQFVAFSKPIFFIVSTICFSSISSIFLCQKLTVFRHNILALVIVASLVSTCIGTLNPVLTTNLPNRILVSGMLSFLITVLVIAIILHRNSIADKNRRIRRLSSSFSSKEAQYLQLKTQVNPHFLFNNLNTLISLIETNPKKAIDFGHHLSNVYRHYLQKEHAEDFVFLNDEIQFITNYLNIYNVKFENSFSVKLDVQANSKFYIVSLCLQEVIDNIFKHNFADDQNPLQISIYISHNLLMVENSIHPKITAQSTGIGLENICRRYELLTYELVKIEHTENLFCVGLPLLTIETE